MPAEPRTIGGPQIRVRTGSDKGCDGGKSAKETLYLLLNSGGGRLVPSEPASSPPPPKRSEKDDDELTGADANSRANMSRLRGSRRSTPDTPLLLPPSPPPTPSYLPLPREREMPRCPGSVDAPRARTGSCVAVRFVTPRGVFCLRLLPRIQPPFPTGFWPTHSFLSFFFFFFPSSSLAHHCAQHSDPPPP